MLQPANNKAHILGVTPYYLFNLISDFLEERIHLPKINPLDTHFTL